MNVLSRLQQQEKKLKVNVSNFSLDYVSSFKSKLLILSNSKSALLCGEAQILINSMIKTCNVRLLLLS